MATLAAGMLAAPATAQADEEKGFLEVVLGQMTPMGEDQWDDALDSKLKLGLHGGVWARRGIGLELAFDYTGLDEYDNTGFGYAIHGDSTRLRTLIGGRTGADLSKNVRWFGRLLLGADYVRASVDGMIVGQSFSGDDSDVGLAAEIGGGVLINVFGAFSVGAQVAIPMAFHSQEQDIPNKHYLDFDYNAYDLDLMLTLGTSF